MKTIYGGYIMTGGTLDDGKPWAGFNVLLAEVKDGDEFPVSGMIAKARRTEDMMRKLQGLPIGCPVEYSCDLRGRLTTISPAKAAGNTNNTH